MPAAAHPVPDAAAPADAAGLPAAPLPEDVATQVIAVLPRVMDAMRQAMRVHLAPAGRTARRLTVPQFRGLNYVALHPGCSLSDVAGFLGVTLATASAMVDRLEREDCLRTEGSPTDRRRRVLRIRPAGRAALEHMRRRTQADLARALRGQDAASLAAVVDGLAVLDRAFADLARQRQPAGDPA